MTYPIIRMIRGDTYEFDILIEDSSSSTGYYELKEDDKLYLGITRPHQPFETAIIRKRYTKENQSSTGVITVTIEPEDTLDIFPGVYYYSAKLLTDTEVKTIIHKAKFIICD